MPKEVDHAQRRKELLEAVWRVVVRNGLEGATVRGMAEETGWSSGVLAHYFKDKDDILESALRLAYERIDARRAERLEGLRGFGALRALVLDNLPLDPEQVLETKFVINYWSRAIRDPGRIPQPARRRPTLLHLLTETTAEAQADGEMTTDRSAEDIAELLHSLIDGLSLHALLDPERLTPERQVALVDAELDRLAGRTPKQRPRRLPAGSRR
jgi:AcrR family transcriptional regulator